MYNLHYKNGLLYASIILQEGDKSIIVEDVIVDTGAYHTIILTDYLEDLDAEFTEDDELVKSSGYGGLQMSSVRKKIDKVTIGDISLTNMKIDFGEIDPYERVNGLIGLDFLRSVGVIIDLVDLTMYKKNC
ncbi:retropepsin-like aspartic protease [Proteiniborus sp.]|uniref:retropepsin-like aspartic protease n=1 Tax=Proteiniborus sp. TaxID=2079015 RepID=UPI003332F86A